MNLQGAIKQIEFDYDESDGYFFSPMIETNVGDLLIDEFHWLDGCPHIRYFDNGSAYAQRILDNIIATIPVTVLKIHWGMSS